MDLRFIFALAVLGFAIWFAVKREKNQAKQYEKKQQSGQAAQSQPEEKAESVSESACEPAQKAPGDVAIRVTGDGEKVSYDTRTCGTSRIMWVSRETASDGNPLRIRMPKSESRTYKQPLPFQAAGKRYTSLDKLLAEKKEDGTYRDCHGRVVLSVTERFPCFDSHDYANENRYYRWWIIVEEGFISRVYHTDEQREIYVTDDVQDIEENCLSELKKHGYVI